MRSRPSPILLLLLGLLPLAARAGDAPLPLKMDRTFKKLPAAPEGSAAFINAQHVEAKKGDQLEASGNVELRQSGQVISAAYLLYGQVSKDVLAEGSVRFEQNGAVVQGPVLKMNLDTNQGEMSQPQYEFSENHARGEADRLLIAGRKNYTFEDATYTTCPEGNDDWLLRMSRLEIDRNTLVGTAHNTWVEFKGVPVLYTPWMDFSLTGSRRSGFLGPTIGSTNKGGSEIAIPYYWNIAPNMDATLMPRVIAKRGTQFNNEFRYLEPTYGGEAHYDILSNDKLTGLTRTFMSLKHSQNLGGGFNLGLNASRVSDNAYFRDLTTTVNSTSQTILLRDSVLSYGGSGWSASARVQRFQSLDPAATQYRRQPQLALNAQQSFASTNINLASEYTDFRHDTAVNGERLVLYPTASYPLLSDPGYYLTPKLGMHYTQYRLGANNTTGIQETTRTLPIFSLDSGLAFERDIGFSGRDYVQTLEPRLYYVNIPYRNQDALPVFDTAQAPFNFGQIFTENRFFGSDRIGDANMVTTALTSRLIDNEDGTERLRVMLGERFSFRAPRVNLLTPTNNTNRSDVLMSVGGRLTKAWSLDSLYQYNPNQAKTQSYNVMARYRPQPGKLINLGYRFDRNATPLLRQMDLSTQWPLFGRWLGVARFNYSLPDKRVAETLAGVEYNQACWTVRFVAQSFTTTARDRATGIFLQLELNDLVRIGSDPLDALRNSVSGYTKMNSLPVERPMDGLR